MSEPLVVEGYKRCGARKRDGNGCRLPAGHGTGHVGRGPCRKHGGNTSAHIKHAKKQEIVETAKRFGLPIEIEPDLALLQEMHRTVGHVVALGRQVEEASPGTELEVAYGLYAQERGHLARVAKAALDVGIMERQVRVSEEQGALVAAALRRILDDLELSEEQQARAPAIVRRRLLELRP